MEPELEPLVIDESTGLPKLPKEYAWNVSSTGEDKVYVSIFEKRTSGLTFLEKLFGGKDKGYWDYSWRFNYTGLECYPSKECIKVAAVEVYEKAYQKELKAATVEGFVGLYPPKSL